MQSYCIKQAGLSRATLEISSECSSDFPLRTHNSWSIQWLLRYSTLNILRLSSIGGRLHFKKFLILVWSYPHKFKIWGRSDQWLLRYSTLIILRLSSIRCLLHFKNFGLWYGLTSLSFKFDEDPNSGSWYLQLLIIWGCLPL